MSLPAASAASRPIHLPWNQKGPHWLCILPRDAAGAVEPALLKAGMKSVGDGGEPCLAMRVEGDWGVAWIALCEILEKLGVLERAEGAVFPAGETPEAAQIALHRKRAAELKAIAQGLWLGEALLKGDLLCYLQPVVSAPDRVFGYESFARARGSDGKIIGGAAIVEAAKALGIEYAIDRQLQVEAIKTFVQSKFAGFLFINFFPGFIQRPEVYLEGLTETVRAQGVIPKNIVLDITRSEPPRDVEHLKRIVEYCRSKGYAVALDDIEHLETAQHLVPAMRPDYLKLARELIRESTQQQARDVIREIVLTCQSAGVMSIAEGVETKEEYDRAREAGVDLFQGYHFSPPVPVDQVS